MNTPDFNIMSLWTMIIAIAAFTLFPLLINAMIVSSKKRYLILMLIFCVAISYTLIQLIYRQNLVFWAGEILPYVPLRIGPSWISTREISRGVMLFLWIPFLGYSSYLIILHYSKTRRQQLFFDRRAYFVMLFYSLISYIYLYAIIFGVGFSHEDTLIANDFSIDSFHKIHKGMTRQEVIQILGKPLVIESSSWFLDDPRDLCYARNWSAGWFAVVYIKGDKVNKSDIWFSD